MSVYAGPDPIENGLVFYLDAANLKSYDSRENLLKYSEQLENTGGWNQQTSTVTSSSVTAPNGTLTADNISSASDTGIYQQGTVANNTTYTASIYLNLTASTATSIMFRDMGGGGHHIEITKATAALSGAANITSSGITPVGGGWYRVWITYVTDATALELTIRPNSQVGTTTVVAWGAQLEKGSSLTTYVPTTASGITRTTTWRDLISNSVTATLTNGPQYFPSQQSYIAFTRSLAQSATISSTTGFVYGSSPRTISCWMYVNSISLSQYYWGWSYGTPGVGLAMFLGTINGTFYFGGYADDITASGVPLATWFNMVGTYDGTTAILYVNGVELNRGTKTWNTTQSVGFIGNQVNAGEQIDGRVSNASLYNRVLSINEIKQNFNALRGRFGV